MGPVAARSYIEGHELRLRMELGCRMTCRCSDTRPLMETLERKTCSSSYTESMQTLIDGDDARGDALARDVRRSWRWTAAEASLRQRYAALEPAPLTAPAWVDGPLAEP